MNTCFGCKYFDACGDEERTEKCSGYEKKENNKKEVENMRKLYLKEIEKTNKEITATKKDQDIISDKIIDFINSSKNADDEKIESLKIGRESLHTKCRENNDKIKFLELYNKALKTYFLLSEENELKRYLNENVAKFDKIPFRYKKVHETIRADFPNLSIYSNQGYSLEISSKEKLIGYEKLNIYILEHEGFGNWDNAYIDAAKVEKMQIVEIPTPQELKKKVKNFVKVQAKIDNLKKETENKISSLTAQNKVAGLFYKTV